MSEYGSVYCLVLGVALKHHARCREGIYGPICTYLFLQMMRLEGGGGVSADAECAPAFFLVIVGERIVR